MSNKLITPIPSGGIPIFNEDLTMIQNEAHDAINSICAGIDTAFVVSGCHLFEDSLSHGYVFLNGELMLFHGYTGTFPVYIHAAPAVKEQRVFKDGFSKDAVVSVIATASVTQPSKGGYIIFNPDTPKRLKDVVTKKLREEVEQALEAIESELPKKANKAQEDWRMFNITGFFADGSDAGFIGQFQKPEYMKDEFGFVHLRGRIQAMANTGDFTYLPSSYRPSKIEVFNPAHNDMGTNCRVYVKQDGNLWYQTNSTAMDTNYFYLDGISFKAAN